MENGLFVEIPETQASDSSKKDEQAESSQELGVRVSELSKDLQDEKQKNVQYVSEINRLSNENESLMEMRDQLTNQMATLQRESEAQNKQIMRLSGELSQHMEEKTSLEEEIIRLRSALRDPKGYYQQELSRVIDEKIVADDQLEIVTKESAALKTMVAKQTEGVLLNCVVIVELNAKDARIAELEQQVKAGSSSQKEETLKEAQSEVESSKASLQSLQEESKSLQEAKDSLETSKLDLENQLSTLRKEMSHSEELWRQREESLKKDAAIQMDGGNLH